MLKFKLFNGLEAAIDPNQIVYISQAPKTNAQGQVLVPTEPHPEWVSIQTTASEKGVFTVIGDFAKIVEQVKRARKP